MFDTFWREVTRPDTGNNPRSAAYAQGSMARSCLQQIARQLGETELFFHAVREAGADRAEQARAKRARYWGPKR